MQLKAFFNVQDSLFVGKQTHILMLTIKQDMCILKELIFITSRQILISKPLKLTLSTSLETHLIYNSLGLILHIYSLEPSLSRYFHSYLIGDKVSFFNVFGGCHHGQSWASECPQNWFSVMPVFFALHPSSPIISIHPCFLSFISDIFSLKIN